MRAYNIFDIYDDIVSDRRKKIIFDTDAINEVDDQFAIAYAMLSPEKLDILGFVAAPFENGWCFNAKEGMEKSYDELLHMKELVAPDSKIPMFKGSENYYRITGPAHSEGVDFIIRTAMENADDERIYVVGTGAATDIANALALEPRIKDKIVVVWLGTHDYEVPNIDEFNLEQDVEAASVIFNNDLPTVVIPAFGSSEILDLSQPELDTYLKDKNPLCSYLYEIVCKEIEHKLAARRMIFDIAATAVLVKPESILFTVRPAPIISGSGYSVADNSRHSLIYATVRGRQTIFEDMLTKFYSL